MGQLDGKVAIITGSARGIGRSIAEAFIAEGAKVVISDVNAEGCAATAKELGSAATPIACNVTKKDEVANLVATTKEKLGSIDILVNNAGITRDNLFVRMSEEDFDLVVDINLKGSFLVGQAVSKIMMKQRSGKIVNIASVSGIFGNAGQANYAASKGGVVQLTKVMARELATRGISVNAVAPGFIASDMTDKLTDEQKEGIAKEIPMGKMGDVKNVANVVTFLSSSQSDYMTGQVLRVCGGMVM